jgi:hypothetical protein
MMAGEIEEKVKKMKAKNEDLKNKLAIKRKSAWAKAPKWEKAYLLTEAGLIGGGALAVALGHPEAAPAYLGGLTGLTAYPILVSGFTETKKTKKELKKVV